MSALKVAFAGTPEFAREALAAILAAGYEVPLVLTQPDRPAGRGMKPQASAGQQPGKVKVQPGNGSKARTRRARAAAGWRQSMAASALSILCA